MMYLEEKMKNRDQHELPLGLEDWRPAQTSTKP